MELKYLSVMISVWFDVVDGVFIYSGVLNMHIRRLVLASGTILAFVLPTPNALPSECSECPTIECPGTGICVTKNWIGMTVEKGANGTGACVFTVGDFATGSYALTLSLTCDAERGTATSTINFPTEIDAKKCNKDWKIVNANASSGAPTFPITFTVPGSCIPGERSEAYLANQIPNPCNTLSKYADVDWIIQPTPNRSYLESSCTMRPFT